MSDEIITQYLVPSSNPVPTVSDPHAPVGSFLRRDVLLHPFVEKDTVTVDGQERERVIIRMLPDYMTNPYVHKLVMYMMAITGCIHEQVLQHSEFSFGGGSNDSCAISGDGKVAVFGYPYSTVSGNKVIVYKLINNIWVISDYLYPTYSAPITDSFLNFGHSVAISGDGKVIFVGNTVSPLNGQFWCNVHVFRWNGTDWGSPTLLTPSDGNRYDGFGVSVSCDFLGATLVVGSTSATTTPLRGGKAYIFRYINSAWSQSQIINADTFSFSSNPLFGGNVEISLDGKIVAVAAREWSFTFASQGLISIYKYSSSGTWNHLEDIVSPNPKNYGYFGYSMAFSSLGDKLIVAEQSSQVKGQYGLDRSVEVHFFSLSNGSYVDYLTVSAPDAWVSLTYNYSSISVSKDLKNLFIGSPREYVNGLQNVGRMYKYVSDSADNTSYVLDQTLGSNTNYAGNLFGSAIASSYKGCSTAIAAIGKNKYYVFSCDCSESQNDYLISYYVDTYDRFVNPSHDFIVNNLNYEVRIFGQATTRIAMSSDCFVYYWETQSGVELGTSGFFSTEFWIGDLSDSGVGIWSGYSSSTRSFRGTTTVANYFNNNDVPIYIEAINSVDPSKTLAFIYVFLKNDYSTSPDMFNNIIGNAVYKIP